MLKRGNNSEKNISGKFQHVYKVNEVAQGSVTQADGTTQNDDRTSVNNQNGVMISVRVSSVVGSWFDPQWITTKDYN